MSRDPSNCNESVRVRFQDTHDEFEEQIYQVVPWAMAIRLERKNASLIVDVEIYFVHVSEFVQEFGAQNKAT
jgi:hypothetical protein